MHPALLTSTLVAARRALSAQQIRALRDWLGEDHELLSSTWAQPPDAAPEPPTPRLAVGQPETIA
jgi:hypothetical protein